MQPPDDRLAVLVVEDDRAARDALDRALRLEGYDVRTAADGPTALTTHRSDPADLIVLDLMLPGLDGTRVAAEIRSTGDTTPIIMLTARDGITDRVRGLDAGADDYLPKPYALDELLARLRALGRRVATSGPTGARDSSISVGTLRIDEARRLAWRGDRPLDLSRTEFELLLALANNADLVLGHAALYERVWGYDYGDSNNLAVYIRYLRRKTEEHGEPRLIHTVRGVGYVLSEEPR